MPHEDDDPRRGRGIGDGDRLGLGAAYAHHSFAMFDSSQHRLIVQAPGADGAMTTWSFEGAAIVHAARQGVNGKSCAKGEKIRIMHPLRDGQNARRAVLRHQRGRHVHAPERLARVGPPSRYAPDDGSAPPQTRHSARKLTNGSTDEARRTSK